VGSNRAGEEAVVADGVEAARQELARARQRASVQLITDSLRRKFLAARATLPWTRSASPMVDDAAKRPSSLRGLQGRTVVACARTYETSRRHLLEDVCDPSDGASYREEDERRFRR